MDVTRRMALSLYRGMIQDCHIPNRKESRPWQANVQQWNKLKSPLSLPPTFSFPDFPEVSEWIKFNAPPNTI